MQDVTAVQTNGTVVRQAATLEDIAARLADLARAVDVISRLACPVCAPAIIAENHPEVVTLPSLHRHD